MKWEKETKKECVQPLSNLWTLSVCYINFENKSSHRLATHLAQQAHSLSISPSHRLAWKYNLPVKFGFFSTPASVAGFDPMICLFFSCIRELHISIHRNHYIYRSFNDNNNVIADTLGFCLCTSKWTIFSAINFVQYDYVFHIYTSRHWRLTDKTECNDYAMLCHAVHLHTMCLFASIWHKKVHALLSLCFYILSPSIV